MEDHSQLKKSIKSKCQKIKLVLVDVDGVLTDVEDIIPVVGKFSKDFMHETDGSEFVTPKWNQYCDNNKGDFQNSGLLGKIH